MRKQTHVKFLLFLLAGFTFIVQANTENIEDILPEANGEVIDPAPNNNTPSTDQENSQQLIQDQVSDDVARGESPQPIENLLTGDAIVEKEFRETAEEEKNNERITDVPILPKSDEENLSQDQEIKEESSGDLLTNLQPLLPGPKNPLEPLGGTGEKGENWEKTCQGGTCTHIIYSYVKNYQKDGLWRAIDENFYSSGCLAGYDFCVTDNLYQIHMKSYVDAPHSISFTYNGISLQFTPTLLRYATTQQQQNIGAIRHSPSQVTNNRAYYPGAYASNVHLEFKYLPRMLKEELLLQTREALPALNLSASPDDVHLHIVSTFAVDPATHIYINDNLWDQQTRQTTQNFIEFRQGTTSFFLAPPFAYDARGVPHKGTYVLEKEGTDLQIIIQLSYTWLLNELRRYPVHIDPTITLDYNSILWDGYVLYDDGIACLEPPFPCDNPLRNGVDSVIYVGDWDNNPALGFTHYRGDLDWDISAIPDLAQIENIQLNLSFETIDANNDEMRFLHMVGGNDLYPDNDSGNTDFYNDLNDGTEYLRQQATGGSGSINTFNLTTSSQLKTDFETFLANGTDTWSIGIRSEEPGTSGTAPSSFTSEEGSVSANRPMLEVIYKPFANETEGDEAIVQAISNVFAGGSGASEQNQQVYVYNSTGGHQLGVFDAVALNASKRWLIGYITSGESFLNLENMSTAVYNAELQNLSASNVTSQVEAFIRGTA